MILIITFIYLLIGISISFGKLMVDGHRYQYRYILITLVTLILFWPLLLIGVIK